MKRAKDEQTPSDEDKYEKYSLYKSDKASPGGQIPPPSSAMTSQVESVYFVNYRAVVVKTKRYYVTQNSYMLFGDVFKIYNLKGEIKKIHAFFPGDENNLSDTLIMLKTTVVAVTTSKAEALRVADGIEMTCKICRKKRKATKFSIEGFLRKVRCDTCRVKPKNLINKMRRVNNVKGEQQTFLAVSSNTTNDSSCTPSAAAAMATSVNPSRTGRKSAPLCNDAAGASNALCLSNGAAPGDGPSSGAMSGESIGTASGASGGAPMATPNGATTLGGSNGMGSNSVGNGSLANNSVGSSVGSGVGSGVGNGVGSGVGNGSLANNSAGESARMHSGEANLGGNPSSGGTPHNGCLSASAAAMNDAGTGQHHHQQRICSYNSKNASSGSGAHSFLKSSCYIGAGEACTAGHSSHGSHNNHNNHNEPDGKNPDEIIAMIIELIKYISWMQKALMRASKGNYVIDHTEINIEKISKVVHSAQVLCNKLLRQKSLVDQTGSNSRNFTNFIPMYNTNSNNLRMKYANLYENKMNAIHSRPIETNLANSNAVNVFNNIINHNTLSLSNCAAAQRNVSATPSCSSGGSGGSGGSSGSAGNSGGSGGSSGSAGNSGGSGGNRTGNDSASNSTSGEGAPNESGPNGTSPTNISNLTSVTNLTNAPSNGSNSNATMETDSPLNNFSTINNRNILPYYSNACQITCVPPSPCSTRNDSRMNHFIKQENNYMYRNKQTEEFPNMQSNNKNSYYTDKQDIVFSALSKQYNSNVNISFNNINNSVSNFYRTVSKNYNIRDTILNLDK